MYLWQKNVLPRWLAGREETLQDRFGAMLSIISKPDQKRIEIQIACRSKAKTERLVREFGGRARKLPRDWLKQFAGMQNTRPLKIGKRLVVSRKGDLQIAPAVQKPPLLVIPAGVAFGTGEHPTTAMSLRLLEELTRQIWGAHAPSRAGFGAHAETPIGQSCPNRMISGESSRLAKAFGVAQHARRVRSPSIVDLGTGTGILALAAKKLGACRVLGIENDPMAISTARKNARSNQLRGISFQLCDVHSWKPPRKIDVVTANLFSELLIELLPKLKHADWMILSGILREQERDVRRALQRNRIKLIKIRRRGKWIAILARNIRPAARTGS